MPVYTDPPVLNEEAIRQDERNKIIRLIEGTGDHYTSAYTGYTEKRDIKDHMKRAIINIINASK